MGNPLPIGGIELALRVIKQNKIIHGAILLIIFGMIVQVSAIEPVFYAHAYSDAAADTKVKSPIFKQQQSDLFEKRDKQVISAEDRKPATANSIVETKEQNSENDTKNINDLSDKIYAVVGEAPIKEMVPFIAKNDIRVAAFLVGIAKKESGLGQAAPSKEGRDCYNYWGYKGQGGRGSVLGYSCFASAQEAVETVGGRIGRLVDNQRNTPLKMVNTWKCGGSCAGDPGAPGWVSTVSQYFNKIVENVG